jgi:hypothetical protein
MPIFLKYGNLNLLKPSGRVQACNGIALPFTFLLVLCYLFFSVLFNLNLSLNTNIQNTCEDYLHKGPLHRKASTHKEQ